MGLMNTFLVWDPWATKYGVWIQEYHMGIEVTVMEVGQISLLSGPGVGVESHGVVPWTTYCFHVFHGLQHPQCLGAVRHGPILKHSLLVRLQTSVTTSETSVENSKIYDSDQLYCLLHCSLAHVHRT